MHLWSINYEKALNFISHQDLSEDLKNEKNEVLFTQVEKIKERDNSRKRKF